MKTLGQVIFLMVFFHFAAEASNIEMHSPNQKINVQIQSDLSVLTFEVKFNGRSLVDRSPLGLDFKEGGRLKNSNLQLIRFKHFDTSFILVTGKTHDVREVYNEYFLRSEEKQSPHRKVDLVFRIFNDGIGFRYEIPKQESLSEFIIADEFTSFAVHGDPIIYGLPLKFNSSFEDFYFVDRLSHASAGKMFGLPVLLGFDSGVWVGITEAALTDYAGMYLSPMQNKLTARLAPSLKDAHTKVKGRAPFNSPWRVLLIAEKAGSLLESNIIASLNPPSKILDTSWIHPGKVQFPWWNGYVVPSADPGETDSAKKPGLNTWTLKRYIDFCSASGIEYHSFDGFDQAWYGGSIGEPSTSADVTKVIPELDMPELLRYGKMKGVRARLWMHWRALANSGNLDRVFSLYEKWGIEGIMVDFLDRDDQEMVRFYTKIIQAAARHHLTVNFHGIWKPTGVERTYPNLLSHEGVLGAEYDKWLEKGVPPEHEMIVAFVRALAGPLDFHPGSFRPVLPQDFKPQESAPRSIGTLARQLAMYVVFESHAQMLVDYPEAYLGKPEAFEFVQKVPVNWDETRVLEGVVGEFVTIARRKGNEWFIGTFTDRHDRRLQIPLDFLGNGDFLAKAYSDTSESRIDAGSIGVTVQNVRSSSVLNISLAPSGGNTIHIFPAHRK